MNRNEILEREQRWARIAGLSAIAIVPLYIASTYLEGSAGIFEFALRTERQVSIDANSGQLLLAAVLRAAAFALFLPPLLYLFRAAQARSPRVSPAMVGFVFIGPILFAIAAVIASVAQTQVATDFVASAGAGGDIYTLFDDLFEESTATTVAASLFFPAVLGILVAMIYVPLQAMRVGLLTRFFATLGMALGASLLLIQQVFALLAISIWFAWLGFLILGRGPRARPPAWAAGEAIPWSKPGEQRAEPSPEASSASRSGISGSDDDPAPALDAQELVSPAPAKDQAARRERARKKKRKRR